MNTILLVEDNPHIMRINAEVLSLRGYEVLRAATAAEARRQLQWHPVDLIVLDIMLPDANGLDLCRELKCRYHVPILFLTALGETQDVVEGLRAGGGDYMTKPYDLGADDYLTKPYDLEVFVARVEARLRERSDSRRHITYGCLLLDTVALTGFVNGQDIQLTQKEFTVLLLLAQNAERRVSSSELAREVWGDGADQENSALWTLISRLRKKLKSDESRLEIASLRGGYLLEQL